MPNKEISDKFLSSLVSALNKTSLYQPNHPLFKKASEDFMHTLESTFNVIDPIEIAVTINSLIIKNETFTIPAYRELAKRLHLYRVKKIEITRGITSEELSLFFSKISMPIKEVFNAGGMANILNKEITPHLLIQKLDYSELLTKDAGEYKEIWPFLLEEAVTMGDDTKLMKLAEDFGKMISSFTVNEILDNTQILENIKSFISCIRNKDKDKFSRCVRENAQHVFRTKALHEEQLNKIKSLFDTLSESDFSEILSSEICDVDRLDNFSLDSFSRIIGPQRLDSILSLTVKHIRNSFIGNKKKLKYKIEYLLNSMVDKELAQTYRSAFSEFLGDNCCEEGISFERDSIKSNYRLLELHLFTYLTDKEILDLIIKDITTELNNMNQTVDFEYLALLINAFKKKKEASASQPESVPGELDRLVTAIIEKNLWGVFPDNFKYLINYPQSSVMDAAFYLNKMFIERLINSLGLRLFLKFFPNDLSLFYEYVSKNQDIELAEKTITVLKTLDINLSVPILEQMYSCSNTYIKLEILRTIGHLGAYRKEFISDVLSKGETSLKQEVLIILMKDEKRKQEALDLLFHIDNPWRVNSEALLTNIRLIEELGISYTKDYLLELNKKLFFWHWLIKKEIKRVLNKWK